MPTRVLFIANPAKLASYYMRAETIANRLREDGFEVDIFLWHGWRDSLALFRAARRADCVISVKLIRRSMIPSLLLAGRKLVYDCVDNFNFREGFAYGAGRRWISEFIVNNGLHRDFIAREFALPGQPVSVIEHHHSNFARASREGSLPTVVGYIGNPRDYAVSEAFEPWCNERGLRLYVNHNIALSNEEAIRENLKLDVYFMLLPVESADAAETERLRHVKNFKPAQKILLPFSLGMPTICAPYHAYVEAVRAAGFEKQDFIFVETEAELRAAIDKIRDPANAGWLQELIARQKKVAENYHLDKIIGKYRDLVARHAAGA